MQINIEFGSSECCERLSPVCEWAAHYRLCQGLRRRWRTGAGLECDLACDLASPGDQATCYDCEADLLTLGTSTGLVLCWDTSVRASSIPSVGVRAVRVKSSVDKVYTRHSLVIILQGGLVQVYNKRLELLYCKTLEDPDPSLFDTVVVSDIDEQDDCYLPPVPLEMLRNKYRPRRPLRYTDLDITLSTSGRPLLCVVRGGEARARVYDLTSGEMEAGITAEEGDTFFKIGLVPVPEYSDLVYSLVRTRDGRIMGATYSLEAGAWLWRLELDAVFSPEEQVFSVFTPRGLLMFGRQVADTSYPYTWLWRGASYGDGSVFYLETFETEFPMVLSDWGEGAVVTPRAMSFLFTSADSLAFTQRGHRGTNIMSYTWGGAGHNKRLWKSSCGTQLRSEGKVLLCGSELGGVVITCPGSLGETSLSIRDLETGVRLCEVKRPGPVSVLWADETKIVIIDKNLENLSVIKMI